MIYFIKIDTREESADFCKWLFAMNTPFSVCVNSGEKFTFKDDVEKLYWLSGFQALVENKI